MALLKSLELSIRRNLIRLLGAVTSRGGQDINIDINIPQKAKVLFLRQDRIGDLLISTAVIHAIAKCKPLWQLDILLGKGNFHISEHDPVINKRWMYDKKIWGTLKLIRALRKEKYDVVIDLMDKSSATSTAMLSLICGKINAGLEKENSFSYNITASVSSKENAHAAIRLAGLLPALGCNVKETDLRLSYTTGKDSRKRAEDFFTSFDSGKIFCCVNISARQKIRVWPADSYRMFLEHVSREMPGVLFFIAAQPNSDENIAQSISEGIERVHVLPVSASFDEFAAMVDKTDIVVTPDTAMVHLASALGKKTVALYNSIDMAERWSPFSVEYRAVISPTGTMDGIKPEAVAEALHSILHKT